MRILRIALCVLAAVSSARALDVKIFGGAVGDGIADDTSKIQNTINATAAGGIVTMTAGTYKITSTITMATQRTLQCSGNPVIKSNFVGFMFRTAIPATAVKFDACIFDGGASIMVDGTSTVIPTSFTITHNTFRNQLYASPDPNFQPNFNIFVVNGLNGGTIQFNTFSNILYNNQTEFFPERATTVINGYDIKNVSIVDNTFDRVNEGIHFWWTTQSSPYPNVVISRNTFTNVHRMAIELQGTLTQGLLVESNNISAFLDAWCNSFALSTVVDGGTGTIVRSNTVVASPPPLRPTGVSGCDMRYGYGIEVGGHQTLVELNQIQGNWYQGISIGNAPNYVIQNNTLCGGAGTQQISFEVSPIPTGTMTNNTKSNTCVVIVPPPPVLGPTDLVVPQTGVGQLTLSTAIPVTASTPLTLQVAYDHFSILPVSNVHFVSSGAAQFNQNFGLRTDGGTGIQCIASFDSGSSGIPTVNVSGWQVGAGDYGFSAICERDPGRALLTLRVCHMDGSGCQQSSASFTTPGTFTLGGMNIGRAGNGAGNNSIYGKLALLRLTAGTLYNGTGLNVGHPVPPNAHNAPPGMIDSEFDDSELDAVGTTQLWSLSPWDTPVGWVASEARAPVCFAGDTRSFRAGAPFPLKGDESFALDWITTSLSFQWSQLPGSGPSELRWSSHNSSSPVVDGATFGQYNFALTIKDGTGVSRSCGAFHGVVSSDAKGNLLIPNKAHQWIFTDSNPDAEEQGVGVPALFDSGFLPDGQGIRAFPFFQTQLPFNAREMMKHVRNATEFNTPGAGTVSFVPTCTGWSGAIGNTTCSVITGIGTNFQVDFCGGGFGTDESRLFVLWYKSALVPGSYGRRVYPIRRCDSATQITLGQGGTGSPWSFVSEPGVVDTSQTSGLNYTVYTSAVSGWWWNNGAPGAYYDTPQSMYYLWYATGLDEWRDAAREYADDWIRSPHFDMGGNLNPDAGWWQLSSGEPRGFSLVTCILRALDGRPELWAGIRRSAGYLAGGNLPGGSPMQVPDLRNSGYVTYWVALLSVFDPDSSQRASWYAMLKNSFTNMWTPMRISRPGPINYWVANDTGMNPTLNWDGRGNDGLDYFDMFSAQARTGIYVYHGTANVTTGTKNVTGTGTNFADTYDIGDTNGDNRGDTDFYRNNTSGGGGCKPNHFIWFTDASNHNVFLSNFDFSGDAQAYRIASTNSQTSITLVENYHGTTGSKNFVCGLYYSAMMGQVQPFMLTIAMHGFVWAREAALVNSDFSFATIAKTYAEGSARFIQDRSYDPLMGGQTYLEVTPAAESADRTQHCDSCDSINGPNDRGGERVNGIENAYYASVYCRFAACDDTTKTELYRRFGQLYGKPNTGAMVSDGVYVVELDHGWNIETGQYMQKWLGYCLGIGTNEAALSVLDGGLVAKAPRAPLIIWKASDHPSASKARVTVTNPGGNVTETTVCTASPCALTSPDARAGDHRITVDLLNAANAVVLPGRPIRLGMQ